MVRNVGVGVGGKWNKDKASRRIHLKSGHCRADWQSVTRESLQDNLGVGHVFCYGEKLQEWEKSCASIETLDPVLKARNFQIRKI